MKQLKTTLLICSSILLFISCNNTSDNPNKIEGQKDSTSFDLAKAKLTIQDMDAKFSDAVRKGDSATMASEYADDAMVFPPNSEAIKKEGIASLWGEFLRMGVKEFKLTIDDITGNANMLAETGRYEVFGAGNKSLDKGKYVVTWRNYNGNWKIFRDIWNTSITAPK
jgi:ketosteroid isomerase-like protein